MPLTAKGTHRAVNEKLAEFSPRAFEPVVTLSARQREIAQYVTRAGRPSAESPILRGVSAGLVVLRSLGDASVYHTYTQVRPRYKLASEDSPRSIDSMTVQINPAEKTKGKVNFAQSAAILAITRYAIWLGSSDVSSRRHIPDAVAKRLDTAAERPEAYLERAIDKGLDLAADLTASYLAYEERNGITDRGSNIPMYAIYGAGLDGMDRVTSSIHFTV